KIQDAAELMEIRVLDHLIVGKSDCYSFAENCLL
ncbi:TPA: JAB domain-containing protein, partial [Haemophilus influenzae]